MSALLEMPHYAVPANGAAPSPSGAMPHGGTEPQPQSGIGPLTEGLAQVLQGLGTARPQTAAQAPYPPASPFQTAPVAQSAPMPQAPSLQPISSSITVEQLLQALQPPPQAQQADSGLETLRMQMFGKYYQEIEGRMAELRQVIDGGVARARRAMLERVDELGAALHRDMVALRQETQTEIEDLKRDVFTTVMSLSAINDKLGLADSRNRETWMAVTKALTDRIEHQSKTNEQAINAFRAGVDEGLEQRVARTVENVLVKLAAARRNGSAPVSYSSEPSAQPVSEGLIAVAQ